MSLLGFILVVALAALVFVAIALAFARALFYASVLTELDGSREIQRRLQQRLATGRRIVPEQRMSSVSSPTSISTWTPSRSMPPVPVPDRLVAPRA